MKCTNAIQQKDELSRRNGHPGREASGIHTSRVGACLIAALIALLLSACGESGTTEDVTRVTQSMEVVTDVSLLPPCSATNEGELVWVRNEATPRMCSGGKWYAVAEGSVTATCTTEPLSDGSGVKVLCGGDSIGVVLNGKDGKDGEQGLPGEKGENGQAGNDGVAGTDGMDGLDGRNGIDGKDGKGGAPGPDGKDGEDGKDGTPGEDGKDGENGHDGKDGVGCSVESVDEFRVSVVCGSESAILFVGEMPDTTSQGEVALDSEKIAIALDQVSGVTQKGPFLSGSKVLVREMEDGRTLTQTGNSFNGKILNDNGEFRINGRMLVSQYVMLEATGYYRNEVTGKNSNSEITLFAISDVNDRNTVNVNLLTHLEYERVVYLVTQGKMKVRKAKKQAQKEVFALFGIDASDFQNSEDLNIAGQNEADAALLAFSVLLQGDRTESELSELLTKISTDMEEDGIWDDAAMRMKIAEWAADADSANRLYDIKQNLGRWFVNIHVSFIENFEKYIRNFWNREYKLGVCDEDSSGVIKAAAAGKRMGTDTRYICRDNVWQIANDFEKDIYGWADTTDGAIKKGNITGRIYIYDEFGVVYAEKGWRYVDTQQKVEELYGGCREELYDSLRSYKEIRNGSVYAEFYLCEKETHRWRWLSQWDDANRLFIDTFRWPDATDGTARLGDSLGVVDLYLYRTCYVWDDAEAYEGWRDGNQNDCLLGLQGCTARREGEILKGSDGLFYVCSNNTWEEYTEDDVYVNTYLYRCTKSEVGENVYKEGDFVYGIEKNRSRYVCDNEKWRAASVMEEILGMSCVSPLQGTFLGDTLVCDSGNWRKPIFYDFPLDKDWTNPDLTYGVLLDSRDGRTYKTIEINGTQVMAENLQYADSSRTAYLKGQSWCYNNDTTNCLKGGRFYSWSAAMNIDSTWNFNSPYKVENLISTPHQGICPEGWHIPTDEEWELAIWLTALPVGWAYWTNSPTSGIAFRDPSDYYRAARFWSATENGDDLARSFNISYGGSWQQLSNSQSGLGDDRKMFGFSVRCFKNAAE
jgi:hypothetical protein